MTTLKEKRFETFFRDPLYLIYKNHLYNYLVRRWTIQGALKGRSFKQILEVGCGISPMAEEARNAVRTDLSWQALSFLDGRDAKGGGNCSVASSATELSFQERAFDCVICSEVLEHIENDEKALDEIYRVLKPGGEFFLTGPIHQKDFGFDDEFVGHYRRYEVDSLCRELKRRGFKHFEIRPVLGRLEKQIMERVTRLFALVKKGETKARPLGWFTRTLAWFALPFYIGVNYGLALLVFFQARQASQENIVNILIHCRK
jgi:ubiquinone/menaquinone biosynthesis C-methylase UbiE